MKTLTKAEKAVQRQEAINHLRNILSPNQKVYTILNHASSSGMSRQITLVIAKDDSVVNLNWYVSRALDLKIGSKDGLVVGGCGMDLVYNLGRVLFPEGFAVEGRGRNGDTSGHDKDGGYALKHSWL